MAKEGHIALGKDPGSVCIRADQWKERENPSLLVLTAFKMLNICHGMGPDQSE